MGKIWPAFKIKSNFLGLFLCLTLIIMLFWTFSSSNAAVPGRSRFKVKCLTCHAKDGEARAFGPTKYASIQWVKFFKREKHKRKVDISSSVSPEDVQAIKEFLVSHAADSDRPEAAGLR